MNRSSLDLWIFIDAFGWELLRRHRFLDDLLIHRQALDTVFGYSSACDPTILTGKLPREHGHFSCFRYSPSTSPFGICRLLDILPRTLTRRGRVRRVISRAIAAASGYTGYFQLYDMPFGLLPLFDYSEKRDLYQPGGIIKGLPTLFDRFRDRDIPFHLSDWRYSEAVNLDSAEQAIASGDPRFAYVYLADLDAVLHRHGTRAPQVTDKIAWYEQRIRQLHQIATDRYPSVRLSVFSDHGMTDVVETCDLMTRIDRLGLTFGRDYAAVYDSTMARFWFLDDSARETILGALAAESRGAVVSTTTLASHGCDFDDNGYGDLFFLMDPGVLLCPSFMGQQPMAGMHGYDPHHKDSLAMLASSQIPEPAPGHLADLFDLIVDEGEGASS